MATEFPDMLRPTRIDPAALLDAAATALLVLDVERRVLYANASAEDLLGLSLSQTYGRAVAELFVEPGALLALMDLAAQRAESCAGHELSLIPVALHQGPASPLIADVVVTPLGSQLAGPHLLLEFTDARLRQRVTQENTLLAQLDSGRLMARQLAHEIRNPLGGLRGAAQLLDRQLPDASLREYTAVIINEADRLRALVDAMLGPSRPPRKAPLNVHEVCEHVWQLLRGEAPAGVMIERDYDPSLPMGGFDRNELIQALLNIARNALQAVGTRGRVILRTRALSNRSIGGRHHRLIASVQVEDDGPGIPPELQQTLFYPLVTGRHDGTGLGLSVAQELARRHDGIVECESRPGCTVFTLLLPLEALE
jgi:two-component system nitrogen regulation sensor histidine kinase GlnL